MQPKLVDQASVQGPPHRSCPTGDVHVLADGGPSLLNAGVSSK